MLSVNKKNVNLKNLFKTEDSKKYLINKTRFIEQSI